MQKALDFFVNIITCDYSARFGWLPLHKEILLIFQVKQRQEENDFNF